MTEQYGYAGKILRVDLSTGEITSVATSLYSGLFLGGRGIAAKIYWDEVSPAIQALDRENRLIFMTGPFCGLPGLGSRFQICGKSIATNHFSFCNLGGSWGAHLKAAGYDGLVVTGKAAKPVYIHIDGDTVAVKDAGHLQGQTAGACESALKNELGEAIRVLTVGPAGENMVAFATFLASGEATGSGGLAGVMGAKNLKAIAVTGDGKVNIAEPDRLAKIMGEVCQARSSYVAPLHDAALLTPKNILSKKVCQGCSGGCVRTVYRDPDGHGRKFMCQSAMFYETRAQRYSGTTDAARNATALCNDYGVDTRAVETMIMWLSRCHRSGILTDEQTGIPLSKIGSHEFIETLITGIAHRTGFGAVLADGVVRAASYLSGDAKSMITDYMTRTGDSEVYGPRLFITTGIFSAMEPRLPIQHLHAVSLPVMSWLAGREGMKDATWITGKVLRGMAKRFFGSELAVDFSTYDRKALAAVMIQNREYVKESLISCDFMWPMYFSETAPDGVGDPAAESRIYSAITGRETDETGLYEIGERLFNLQRAILVREGKKGREFDVLDEYNYTTPLKGDFGNPDCVVPGKNGEPFSRKGFVVDGTEFEKMKDEFYRIRGWDVPSGLQKKGKLVALNLCEVAEVLENEGLLK